MTRIYIAANGKPFDNLEQCALEDEAPATEDDLDHLYDVLTVYQHKLDGYPYVHAKLVDLLDQLDRVSTPPATGAVADLLNLLGVKS